MHEAGIAASILELAEAEARKHGGAAIEKIKVRVGEFTSVVPEALEFAFSALKAGTAAAAAALEIERVPLTVRCLDCGSTSQPEPGGFSLFCPLCNMPAEILSGRELTVEYLELSEPCNASH